MSESRNDASCAIAERLHGLRARIAELARRAGRDPAAVRLIAVSKTQPSAAIAAAVAAGQREFAENTVQEALAKMPALAAHALTWHFIGHLQSNKARFVPGNFAWLHSLDSLALAQRLSRLAVERRARLDALIEVNVSGDPRRHGVSPGQLPALLDALQQSALPNLRLRGLMAMGPHPASEGEVRAAFAAVRTLCQQGRQRTGWQDFTELSMGMSGDYAEAILEGATMVRLGTAVFGERHPRR